MQCRTATTTWAGGGPRDGGGRSNVVRRIYTPTADEAKAGATIFALARWRSAAPGESDALLGELTARGWSSPRVGEPLTDDFADLLRYLRLR